MIPGLWCATNEQGSPPALSYSPNKMVAGQFTYLPCGGAGTRVRSITAQQIGWGWGGEGIQTPTSERGANGEEKWTMQPVLSMRVDILIFQTWLAVWGFQVAEWKTRAEKFEEMCCSVIQMFTRLSNSANRTILYDLYPYIWDIKSIISMVKSFVQWLGRYGPETRTTATKPRTVLHKHQHGEKP